MSLVSGQRFLSRFIEGVLQLIVKEAADQVKCSKWRFKDTNGQMKIHLSYTNSKVSTPFMNNCDQCYILVFLNQRLSKSNNSCLPK